MARHRNYPSQEVQILPQAGLPEELPSALQELPPGASLAEVLHGLAEEPGNTDLIHQLAELLKSDS
jgi:hypothetical protein